MLSPIWRDKQTFVETEDMKLKDIVPDSVLFFKGGKIKTRLDEIMIQMKEAQHSGDTESVISLMRKDQNLKVALRMISEKLGNRIIL
jgi:DNA primase